MEHETRDFILKAFRSTSLLEELSTSTIKDYLANFILDYDLTKDFFDLYFQTLADKKYTLGEIASHLNNPLSEILKTLKTLQKIIESCFAENNLKNNLKLKNLIGESSDGYVSLSTFLKYKNVKALTSSEIFLAKALEDSQILEVSFDKLSVRVQAAYRSQEQDVQVFYYNLDTSQTQITYSSISEGLPLKANIVNKIKNITMLTGNSRVVCYFRPDVVHRVELATGEDKIIGQAKGLSYMDLKQDEDIFIGIIDKSRIILVNLQTCQQTFECRVEGVVDKVLFHPTEKNLIARFSQLEIVLFRYSLVKPNEVTWFKVFPMKNKIINIALVNNLLAAAIGQGNIIVLNTDTDEILANYSPHTYNTLMYSSIITLHFLTPNFLLTSGRSQNEFCITKLDTKEKSHILSIQSLSRKQVSLCGEYILITDPQSPNASVVVINEIDGMLKFCKIIDYKVEGNIILACLNSASCFYVATKTDIRNYFTTIETKVEEKPVQDNSVETAEIVMNLSGFFNSKVKVINEKVQTFSKLNTMKKTLQDSVNDNIDKTQNKDQKVVQDDIKKCVSDTLMPGLKCALDEMLSQAHICAEAGIKEYLDKEFELDTVFDVLQRENHLKTSMITDVTDIYSKNCMRQLRKLEKIEEHFREKQLTVRSKDYGGIQEKINILLAQGDFESALNMVIRQPSKLYSTLNVINPYGLLQGKRISLSLHNKILKQFLIFPPSLRQLMNSAEWLECLIKFKTWTASEKEEARSLLKMHPLGYLVSFISR